MAFQNHPLFADFLRGTVGSLVLGESASSANFLLEERLPTAHEQSFLVQKPGPTAAGWDVSSWWQTFGNHYSENVALPLSCAPELSTFASPNGDNHLHIESHQDVVRLESLRALYQRYPGDFGTVADLSNEIQDLIRSRQPGQAAVFSKDRYSRLASWLDELNKRRDARPAFAAPFGEVESLLLASDWATQLRNVLGLSHFGGSPSKPLAVVLCRYNLSRAERAARKAKVAAWASVPTVLEAGGVGGPGAAFFPFPKAAGDSNPFGFGVTLNLATNGGLDFNSELLHFRVDYTLDDFFMTGELVDEASDIQLSKARQRHFDLLEQDFSFGFDVRTNNE